MTPDDDPSTDDAPFVSPYGPAVGTVPSSPAEPPGAAESPDWPDEPVAAPNGIPPMLAAEALAGATGPGASAGRAPRPRRNGSVGVVVSIVCAVVIGALVLYGCTATRERAPGDPLDEAAIRSAVPIAAGVERSGRGDAMLALELPEPGAPWIVTISHDGDDFEIDGFTADGEYPTTFLHAWPRYVFGEGRYDDYEGTLLGGSWYDDGTTELLELRTDGAWTLRVDPLSAAPELAGTVQGANDAVFQWNGPATRLRISPSADGDYPLVDLECEEAVGDHFSGDIDGEVRDAYVELPDDRCALSVEMVADPWALTVEAAPVAAPE